MNGNCLSRTTDDPVLSSVEMLLDSVEKIMERNHIPGLMLTMVKGDSVIFSGGLGYADLEKEIRVDRNHLFRLGSITKSFAALAMIRLHREGKISLDDRLREVAPEVPFRNRWAETHPVLIKHLLQHTSGFDDMHFSALYNEADTEPASLDLVRAHQKSLYARWKPGTRMAYSNPNYVVITYLIEKITGRDYHEYMRETLFEPLGMENTNLSSFPGEDPLYSLAYKYEEGTYKRIPFYPVLGGLAGVLNSNAADMSAFLRLFLNEGKVDDSLRLFTPEELDWMETPETTLASGAGLKAGYGYGNSWKHLDKGVVFHGHGGGIDGYSSDYAYNRTYDLGYAISNNGEKNMSRIIDLVIQYLMKDIQVVAPDRESPQRSEIEPYLGYYHYKSSRNELFSFLDRLLSGRRLIHQEEALLLTRFMDQPDTLYRAGDHLFYVNDQHTASFILGTNPEGDKYFSIMGDYSEQGSYVMIMLLRGFVLGAFILNLLVLPVFLVFFVLRIFRKLDVIYLKRAGVALLHVLAFLAMIFFFAFALQELRSLGTMNTKTIGVFISSLLYTLFLLWMCFIFFRPSRGKVKRGFRYAAILYALFQVGLFFFLFQGGVIGLRLWAY